MSVPARISQLEKTIAAYRAALLRADGAALAALQESYAPARESLLTLINETVDLVTKDGTITTSEVMQLDRAQELLGLVQQEVTNLANVAGQTIPQTQTILVEQALARAQALAVAQAPTITDAARISVNWTALNRDAVADLTGSLSDGSPLSDWLTEFVPDSVQIVQDTLLDGVARGINAEDLGRVLAQSTDLPLQRAMTLSRTETLRSYRSASIQSYQANDDVLDGWTWSAAHDDKTCSACLAKSGQDFPLTVSFMPTHPRCRCSPMPKLDDPDGLLPAIETGEEWFNRQPEQFRRESFPVGLRGDYDAGRVTLGDMAHLKHNEVWGDSYQTATIGQARANAKARLARGAKPKELPKPVVDIPAAIPATARQKSIDAVNVPKFQTVKEAEAWASENLKSVFGNVSRYKPDDAQELMTAVARFEKRTGKRIPAIITSDNPGTGANGKYFSHLKTIKLRPLSSKQLREQAIAGNAAALERTGFTWTQVDDIESLLIHEAAHGLDSSIGRNGTGYFNSIGTKFDVRNISGYAGTKSEEAWAESFTAWYLEKPEANLLPDDLVEFFVKLTGG